MQTTSTYMAVIGTSKFLTESLIEDIENTVADAMGKKGYGIVTGGKPGIEFVATEEALVHVHGDPTRLIVILHCTLDDYTAHLRESSELGWMTLLEAEKLITQLNTVKQHATLIELDFAVADQMHDLDRNLELLKHAKHVAAFQVNGNRDVAEAVERAGRTGLSVTLHTYSLTAPIPA